MSIDTNVGDYLSHGQLKTAVRKAGGAPCECGCDDACGLERVRFFPRQLLGADDLTTEQNYFREKLRRHNRYLHGWGVVCGCAVRPAATKEKPYQILICPGYVVTPCGDEILIGCPALFDLATCMVTSDDPCAYARPCPPVTSTLPMRKKIYLTVCYKECEVRPVPVAPVGCSCDDVQCDYSRIRDAYEFVCRDSLPPSHEYTPPYSCDDLCQGGVFPCPQCPTDNCVVLATITISGEDPERQGGVGIDELKDRRLLYSTAMLQMMAHCQCGGDLPRAATPVIQLDSREESVFVSIYDSTPGGASIYYTIDGSDPTEASNAYTGTFELTVAKNATVTVKAIAVAPGYRDSAIASADIHANPNP